ncbi:hypothetical protein HDU96_009442 [Phlyctochytrium bullatum]|nr:hypothetical protein HDU96_009442 [Phlyctochytrium bullatum]
MSKAAKVVATGAKLLERVVGQRGGRQQGAHGGKGGLKGQLNAVYVVASTGIGVCYTDFSPHSMIRNCCGCISLKTGAIIIAGLAAAYGIWSAGVRPERETIVILRITYGLVLMFASFAGLFCVMKNKSAGVAAYALFLCISSAIEIGYRCYNLSRLFNKSVRDDVVKDCVTEGKDPADCEYAFNVAVTTYTVEDILIILSALYLTFVFVEYARDLRSNPDKYENVSPFQSANPPTQAFIVYSHNRSYPPRPAQDPFAQDLPRYQPPLPDYDNVSKSNAPPAATESTSTVVQPPSSAVSRDTQRLG